MIDLHEPDLENSCNVMPEHVSHQHIRVVSVIGPETVRNVLDDIKVAFEEFEAGIESVDLKLFFLFTSCFSEKNFVDELKVGDLHDVGDLGKVKFDLRGLYFVLFLNKKMGT